MIFMAAKKRPKRRTKKYIPGLRFTSSRLNDDYYKWTKAIRKRDKTCQWPGCKRRRSLECHHIVEWSKAPSLRYDEKNGVLLCTMHHRALKGKESCYIQLFRVIVDKKYK
jgi:hypothetical protein